MHVVYSGIDHHLKILGEGDREIFSCEARNDSVAPNAWRPNAGCPPGEYVLRSPQPNDPSKPSTEANDWHAEGLWFVELAGIPGHEGIGIHGGGSCAAPNWLAAHQRWCPTMNCIRVQNADLARFVALLKAPCPIKVVQ
jgi:hypothetical protein